MNPYREEQLVEAAIGRDQELRAKARGEDYDWRDIGDTLDEYRAHCLRFNIPCPPPQAP